MLTTLWNGSERVAPLLDGGVAAAKGEVLEKVGDTARQIEVLQLERLASAVLAKSPDDLAALRECNPELFWEWLAAFRQQKLEAEAKARIWSAAMAAVATAPINMSRTINE